MAYNVFIIFTILCIPMTQIMYINFKCCTFEIATPIQRFLNWTVKMSDIYLLNCVMKKFTFHTICCYDYFIIHFYIYYNVLIIFTILYILMTQIMYINFKCCTFEIATPTQGFLNWTVKMPDIYLLNCVMKKNSQIHIFFTQYVVMTTLSFTFISTITCLLSSQFYVY